ncbi:MAG: carboxypeptidase-like regulatory domain-containing protein [Acidobacteriia bacterium]|nr:carboxypeptidase-like regulatory domain-containing protein [Terriglobia bacterium]
MRVRQLLALLMVVTLVTFLTPHLISQAVNFAQMHGSVNDPTGAAIVGATIKATQTDTGLVRTTLTTSQGTFTLPSLPVGPYKLEITAPGFQNYIQTGITLRVSQDPKIDVHLQLGTVSVVEEVRGDAVMVNTNETSVSQVVDQQRTSGRIHLRPARETALLCAGALSIRLKRWRNLW